MSKFRQGMDRYQELLMPKRIVDCIEDKHLAKLVVSICDVLDLSKTEAKYKEIGQHAYDPRVMTAILFYGYAIGIRSSRQLAKACKERLDFIFISKGLKPTHDRISDFRKDNLEVYRDFLKESYELSKIKQIDDAHKIFSEAANLWTKVSTLFDKTGETQNVKYIDQASEILVDLSKKEKKAMELLLSI